MKEEKPKRGRQALSEEERLQQRHSADPAQLAKVDAPGVAWLRALVLRSSVPEGLRQECGRISRTRSRRWIVSPW